SMFFDLGVRPITYVLALVTEAISNTNHYIEVTSSYTGVLTPFKTSYGNGLYNIIELYFNGREVWW
ncbi:hypothetical protein ACJBXM_11295, partial [Streptococcus suis]